MSLDPDDASASPLVFSIIVPLLMTITALISRQSAIGKSFIPLLIPAVFIFSASMMNSGTAYFALLLLPISWGIAGILNYLETK